jgi:transposase-like protein
MEGRQRRSFTDDYKRQAVDLVASSGRSGGSHTFRHRRKGSRRPAPKDFRTQRAVAAVFRMHGVLFKNSSWL